ncbi:UNVERIFIED_CONTAM: hypothetical protein Sindi_2493400, partial [Sesamum indicum]
MLGRACCRSPAAMLECVVGWRALACVLGDCVRNGRVSGDWRVWVCWISARAATTSPASRFSRRPKRAPALAAVGFLCCIPIAKAFYCLERPVFALCRTRRGRGRGGPRGARCVPRPAHGHTCSGRWPIASSPDLSDAEHTVGTRTSASVYPKSKRSALRGNARQHFGLVPCGRRSRYSLFDGTCYSDNRSNFRANTCNKPRLLEGMHLLDKRSTRAPPVAAMIHDNSTDRTALVPATHHTNFCPINIRWVRFQRGSLRNGYHIQGRQQARKLPNPEMGRSLGWPSVDFGWLFALDCGRGFQYYPLPRGTVGGPAPSGIAMSDFHDMIADCALTDAGYTGSPYTWYSRRLRQRLDRVLVTDSWMDVFSKTQVTHLELSKSDHRGLLVIAETIVMQKASSFRFQHMWITHPGFLEVVRRDWQYPTIGSGMVRLQQKLTRLKHCLKEWNRTVFGNVFDRVAAVERDLKEADEAYDIDPCDRTLVER